MMRRLPVILVGMLGLLGVMTGGLSAQPPLGPVCFSTLPFSNVFAWLIDVNGNQLLATGQDLTTGSPQTVNIIVSGNTANIGFITHDNPPTIGSGTIDLSTMTGPGTCYQVNAGTTGCANGTAFTFAVVTCPAGAN